MLAAPTDVKSDGCLRLSNYPKVPPGKSRGAAPLGKGSGEPALSLSPEPIEGNVPPKAKDPVGEWVLPRKEGVLPS